MESASVAVGHAAEHEHHGPPPANRSSRVEAQFLGMLLFIISEVMLFGAFFTAYFFIRVVNHDHWPAPGTKLPVAVAGVNTAILLSSSLTMHWSLVSAKNENRFGMRAGLLSTFLLGLTFLTVQINEYVHIGFAPHDHAQGTIFYGLTGLPGAHVGRKSSATDMVSDADRAAEATVTELLRRERPDDGLLGEEGSDRTGLSGRRWVVDPLDGTTNFLYGIPQWAVSVALEDGHGVAAGVVRDPVRDETFAAARGAGATLNGEPIALREPPRLARALIAPGFSY